MFQAPAIIITQTLDTSQVDTYPDDSWVMPYGGQSLFHVRATGTPDWNSFPPAVGQMGYVPSHSSISS